MKFDEKISPVLLGGDLNAYSVARAFFEAEGLSSMLFMRYKTGITSQVKFINTSVNGELCRAEVLEKALLDYAKGQVGERLLLVPCADWYTDLLQSKREELMGYYDLFLPPEPIWRRLKDKSEFYRLLDSYKIPRPEGIDFDKTEAERIGEFSYPYPAVLKPADSAEYWRFLFPI